MQLPNIKLTHYQYQLNFLFQGPKLWNIITSKYPNLDRIFSIKCFKRTLKHILINMQSYGNTDDWTISNYNIEKYYVTIKNDPYYKQFEIEV